MTQEQVVLQFTRPWRSNGACYRPGELASFGRELAKTLVESKFANRVDTKTVQAAQSKQRKADE